MTAYDVTDSDFEKIITMIEHLNKGIEYKELYHKYLKQLVENYINNEVFANTVQKVDKLINNSIKNDATAFYNYEQYEKALPVLNQFAKQRAASITAQLAGKQPSTLSEQHNDSSHNIDAASIDLSLLGGKNRMGEGMRQADGGQPQGGFPGENMPDQENMMKIREIMKNVENGKLSDEQISQLKKLGLDDTMIERMKNMPADRQRNGPPGDKADNPFGGGRNFTGRITTTQIACFAISLVCVLLCSTRFVIYLEI